MSKGILEVCQICGEELTFDDVTNIHEWCSEL